MSEPTSKVCRRADIVRVARERQTNSHTNRRIDCIIARSRYKRACRAVQSVRLAMAIVMDFDLLKQELQRSVEELRDVTAAIDMQLLEDLKIDEDTEDALPPASAKSRMRDLMVAQTKLSRTLSRTEGHWDYVLQSITTVEAGDQRQAFYDEALLHWRSHGGDQVMSAAWDLLYRLEVAHKLLAPKLPPSLPQQGTDQVETVAPPPQRRFPLMTPVRSSHGTVPEDSILRDGAPRNTHQVSEELSQCHARSQDEAHPERVALPHGALGLNSMHLLSQEQFVRLPKFDLPTFVGEIEKFPQFWDAYNSAIHANPILPPVVKFHHLRSLLRGDAQAIVAGYDITAENYDLAVHTLRETYYRPQLIRTQLSTRLQLMKPAGTSALHQRTTLAQIKSLWLQLQKLGDHEDNIFVMRFIRQKFPQRTLEHLGSIETADPIPWKVPQLLDGLDRAIRTFETVADTAEQKPVHAQALAVCSAGRGRSHSRDSIRSDCSRDYSSSPTPDRRHSRCEFCRRSDHLTADCDLVTSRKARLKIVIEEDLCRVCFAIGHKATRCKKSPCALCRRKHHTTLCPNQQVLDQRRGERREDVQGQRAECSGSRSSRSSSRNSDGCRSQSPSPATRRGRCARRVSFSEPEADLRRPSSSCSVLSSPLKRDAESNDVEEHGLSEANVLQCSALNYSPYFSPISSSLDTLSVEELSPRETKRAPNY